MGSFPEILGRVVDYAFEELGGQLLYLCCYERNVDGVENATEKLRDARERLQHSVDTTRRNAESIEDDVKHWMEKVTVISKEIEKFHARAESSNCRFPHLWSRYQLSKRAKKLSEAIVEVLAEGSFGRISYRMAPMWMTGTSSVQASDSRIALMDEILESLNDPRLKMVGVFGLGGVGKTTLVTEVAKRVAEDNMFNVVVKATATQKMEVSKIQKELAEFLGLVLQEETECIRAIRLRDRLKMENRVLIVLDDLWEGIDLDKVGIPFGDEHKGCKILLTSRSQEVLSNQVDCQKTFYVECLPDDEAWSLFKNLAELEDSNIEHEILRIAPEVAKRCGGLPLAIITVSTALRKKGVAHWRDALRQLKSPPSRNITKAVDSCIEFSYRHLENDELRALFLLCACICRDSIFIEDLVKYSVGLGFLSGTSTVAEIRDKLETMLTTLKASCLLLGSVSSDYLRMHDVVRDVGISIAAKHQNQLWVRLDKLNDWPEENQLQKCKTIYLIDCEIVCELPDQLRCPELIFLCIYNKDLALKITDNFFKGVCKLKVLDLTRMQFSRLPPSMAHLTNLESLSLDKCILQEIEVIGYLKKLKVLSLMYSDVRALPQSFENLTQLQLLDLRFCSKLQMIPRNVISAWKKLEELLMKYTSVQWEHEGSNACLTELNHLPMLKVLQVDIQDSSMCTRLQLENLSRYLILIGVGWDCPYMSNSVRALKIKLERSDLYSVRWFKIMLKNVQDLWLVELVGVKSVVNELNEEGFPYLKHLHVENNDEVQYMVNLEVCLQPLVVFPILETLYLRKLMNLVKICHGQLPQASFGKLQVIKVYDCDALRNLLSVYTSSRYLSQLKKIDVSHCQQMKHIFGGNGVEDNNVDFEVLEFNQLKSLTLTSLPELVGFSTNENESEILEAGNLRNSNVEDGLVTPLFSKKVAFLNLETLKIASVHFQKIWQDGPSACLHVQSLTRLEVYSCRHLEYLFSVSVVKCLVKLKHLDLSNCSKMEDIIHMEERTNIPDSEEVWFPSLETMKVSKMNSLKSLWDQQVPSNAYPKLKTIEIESCNKLTTIIPSYMLVRLASLESLEVRHCSSLREVFSMDAKETLGRMKMKKLKNLRCFDLPELKHIWGEDPKEDSNFHSLQIFQVKICHSLKNIFPLSIAKSLANLRVMIIETNYSLEEIVSKDESVEEAARFVFLGMTEMRICSMPELKWFYQGIHTLEFPNLKDLHIVDCDNLELFVMQILGPSELEKTNVVNQKELGAQRRLCFIEKPLPALEALSLDGKECEKIQNMAKFSMSHFPSLKQLVLLQFNSEPAVFPYWLVQRISTLEKLMVRFSSFTEVFPRANLPTQNKDDRTVCHIKELHLISLPKMEYICEERFQLDQTHIENLTVKDCSSLRKLLPSNISVNHLTVMEIIRCDKLESISSISTFKSLVQLATLKIERCKTMVEIIADDERYEGGEGEVEFRQLRCLHLVDLPRLEHFGIINCTFKFPNLQVAIVNKCPRFKIFSKEDSSTPMLLKVQEHVFARDGWYLEGNLNATIRRMFNDKLPTH